MGNREVINRLNELYQKSQDTALTPEEITERDGLRREYLAMIRGQVQVSLESYKTKTDDCQGEHQCGKDCGCGHHH